MKTIEERKQAILDKIKKMKEEGADMQKALEVLGVSISE